MYAYGKNLVALKMSFHNVGAIVQDAQSSCKRQDAAFAATRPVYKQCVLIFQNDLVLPISVQILHISHSLPVSTPLFQQITIYLLYSFIAVSYRLFPLLSITTITGKSSTSSFLIASVPKSSYAITSDFFIL